MYYNDRLNGRPSDFSSPPPLAGHSCVFLDNKLFVLCGVAHKDRGHCTTFHPYSSHLNRGGDYGEESNTVYIFNFLERVWNKAVVSGSPPTPRMGQLALALDNKRAFVFGGRDRFGVCLNDAYIFDAFEYHWERLRNDLLPQPPPRFSTAGCLVEGKVLMFGGRDAERVYGDLWLWDPYSRMWSCPLSVGVPPSSRHGHAMVVVSGGRVVVMGGCGVGPQQENYYSVDNDKAELQVRLFDIHSLERLER